MPRKKKEVQESLKKATIHDFDLVHEPLITEKTMSLTQEDGKYVFKVNGDANKTEIKNAIERVFNVKVESVRTVNVHPKALSRGSRYKGTKSGFKKAYVTLKDGEVINLFQE